MPTKRGRIVKSSGKKKTKILSRDIDSLENFEKKLEKEVKEVEQWVIERKKFFKKLAWVVGLITLLLVLSHIFLRVKGLGV